MTRDRWRALDDAAHRLAPPGATLTHLCSSGHSTYEVKDSDGGRYALKVVDVGSADERSPDEWSSLVRVAHPNVGRYLDTGSLEGDGTSFRWLTMEFIEGVSLGAYLSSLPAQGLGAIVSLLRDAVAGAAALWSAGIAHRDLSPENMLVTRDGRLIVVDLGMMTTHDPVVTPGSLSSWKAPEQVSACSPALGDWRSDQYVLGLVGHSLMQHSARSTDVRDRSNGVRPERRNAADGNPRVPMFLEGVVRTMMSDDPKDRWPSPDMLLAAIDKAASSLGARPVPLGVEPRDAHNGSCARHAGMSV